MALDGAFLNRIQQELAVAVGARVDKIAQPSREELVMHLRWKGDGGKLLLSAGAGNARVHFTSSSPENPAKPPMFCMLLRKHLSGAKLLAVQQIGIDRILHLEFETRNELGDLVSMLLAVEIMGRHSNIILVGPEGRVLDAVRRVDLETSSVRQILPGKRYELPPGQDKLNILEDSTTCDAIIEKIRAGRDVALSKAVLEAVQGLSPILCREVSHRAVGSGDYLVSELQNHHFKSLRGTLEWLIGAVRAGGTTPVMLLEPSGHPKEFSFLPITQYGDALTLREYPDCCSLLDAFYTERDLSERMRQRSGDLLSLLANTQGRISRRLAAQRQELLDCEKRDELKVKGDLISANLYTLQKGDAVAKLVDFYDELQPEVAIELDPMLTPAQNAQRYYALYRKADTAEKKLTALVGAGEQELVYIDSVFDALTRAKTEAELEAIRRELAESGYLRRRDTRKQKEPKLAPLRYLSDDGFTILVGRNNIQNDRLTLKDSHSRDIWLHTQKIPGSHTVIVTEGKEVPKSTIEQACILAAYNSRARESAKVPVDFALVKHVKKPSGAKPGMVIYDHFETVIVDPDPMLAARLLQK